MKHPTDVPLHVVFFVSALTGGAFLALGALLHIEHLTIEGVGIYISFLGLVATLAYINRRQLHPLLQSQLFFRKARLYFSFAYLYRIRVGENYLLVKHKKNDKYQPVGGVFKFHPSEKQQEIFSALEITESEVTQEDPLKKYDLRMYIPGRSYYGLITWFRSETHRELAPLREFYEELVIPGILTRENFKYIDYRHVGTIWSPIEPLESDSSAYGFHVHEVYDLVPDENQALELQSIAAQADNPNPNVLIASAALINRLGMAPGSILIEKPIARHARNTLAMRWT